MEYHERVVDRTLDELMAGLPAIALEGAKAVGKTATAKRRAATILTLTEPPARASVAANFDLVTQVLSPVFVDEWQLEPAVWDRIRQEVDDDPLAPGRFLLAGSADLAPGVRVRSGAGRIISLRMRPMSLAERGLVEPTVSLGALLRGEATGLAGSSP
ncbi:MAG: AAA family ATPase [Propionibacteriaceae bacterium]|jgi:predicted AAA+ superfamily ATPase|nr:AAA family ATPase [Propionibacteriaceae bacterium]